MRAAESGQIARAYDAFMSRAAAPFLRPIHERVKATFEARTGAFTSEDSWFEARSRAFWDDALTSGGLAGAVATPEEAPIAAALAASFRGLFRAQRGPGTTSLLSCVYSGTAWLAVPSDAGLRDAMGRADGLLFDGRICVWAASDGGVESVLLPGALFHSEAATPAILDVVRAARERGLARGEALDALLRMERTLRALSRVKVAYAYSVLSLPPPSKDA